MTQKQIKRYPVLLARISRLEEKIKFDTPASAVCGSVVTSNGPGNSQREEIVSAVDTRSQAYRKMEDDQRKLDDAIAEKLMIDDFVESIEDMRIQEILTRKYVQGKADWKDVAADLGESEAAIKMAVKRFFS